METYQSYEKLLNQLGYGGEAIYHYLRYWIPQETLKKALHDMCVDYDLIDVPEEEDSLI